MNGAAAGGSKPLRVLRVLPMIGSCGTEVQCAQVLEELAAREQDYGVQAEIATFYKTVVDAPHYPRGVMHHFLATPRTPLALHQAAAKLSRLIPQYDVVHALLWPAIWATALAGRDGVPFIASIHSSSQKPGPLGLKRRADRWFTSQADALATVTEAARAPLAQYFGVAPQSIAVVTNGKPLRDAPEQPRSGVISLARVLSPKRHDLILDALALIPEAQRPEISYYGYGTADPAFRRRVDGAGIARARFFGEVQDPLDPLARAELMLQATDFEGLSNTVLEAWNTRTPVLASNVIGVRELIRDGVDGVLADNEPRAWAAAIMRLLGDPSLRAALARNGRARLEAEFSIERAAADWARLYRETARLHGRGSR